MFLSCGNTAICEESAPYASLQTNISASTDSSNESAGSDSGSSSNNSDSSESFYEEEVRQILAKCQKTAK